MPIKAGVTSTFHPPTARRISSNPADPQMFRFSLKWILAAMVYAAIAAAAFSQETWVYADLLCGATLLALATRSC